MIAFKFLAGGAISPFTGFRWPGAGTWVRAPAAGDDTWVHACRTRDLPHWLDDELWRMELDEPVRETRYQIAAPRARLLERIARWDAVFRGEYARACALRARDLALPRLPPALRDAVREQDDVEALAQALERAPSSDPVPGYLSDATRNALRARPAASSYVACMIASTLGGGLPAFEAERAWQARWLVEHLALEPATHARA